MRVLVREYLTRGHWPRILGWVCRAYWYWVTCCSTRCVESSWPGLRGQALAGRQVASVNRWAVMGIAVLASRGMVQPGTHLLHQSTCSVSFCLLSWLTSGLHADPLSQSYHKIHHLFAMPPNIISCIPHYFSPFSSPAFLHITSCSHLTFAAYCSFQEWCYIVTYWRCFPIFLLFCIILLQDESRYSRRLRDSGLSTDTTGK